jgi:hypothetical protein
VEERAKYFPIISKLSLKYDMVISMFSFGEKEYGESDMPLALNVHKEGIKI